MGRRIVLVRCEAVGMGSTAEVSVTWAQALPWRSGRHLLDPVGTGSATDVVRRLGAVLSMDESAAGLAVSTRRTTSRPGDLAAAVASGEVVKAFAFRGAVHHLAADEGGAYLALRAAGRQWERTSWVEHYRLAAGDWPGFRAAVRAALADGPLTLPELGEVLGRDRAYRHLRPVFDEGAGTLVKPLGWQGDLSVGPPRDRQMTVQGLAANPWWRGVPDLDVAGPAAVTAYVGTYGPATHDHVHHWLGDGLSAGRGRLAGWLAGLGDRLVPVDVDGTRAHVLREHVDDLVAAVPSEAVRLLPGHDQWVMGPGTKDTQVIPPPLRDLVTRKAGLVVVGGVVRGTWSRRGDDVTVEWRDERPRPTREIDQEVARLLDR
ncbi:MAG: hypothetical protein JWN84_994 [Nocardioides sp.]|nr:hypothetical protein [Nocardioides sp.]